MKTIIVSKQTFEEIKSFGHGVPRTENRDIQTSFKVSKEYFIHEKGVNDFIRVRCTQDSPTHLTIVKSPECLKVLQLMDEDYTYQEALKMALEEFNHAKQEQLEKELTQYI